MELLTLREKHVRSIQLCYEYHWMLAHQLFLFTKAALGDHGLAALGRGFRRYGCYRGQSICCAPGTFASGLSALSLIKNWDGPELALGLEDGGSEVAGSARKATITLPRVPGSDFLTGIEGPEVLGLFWPNTLRGIADGYGSGTSVEWSPADRGPENPWTISWSFPTDGEFAPAQSHQALVADPFGEIESATVAARRALGLSAALHMYVAKEMIASFGATGEEIVREACYEFGAVRGREARARALAEGEPLTFVTMLNQINERDPHGALFVYRGDVHISDGVFEADCVYCPLAQVWAEEGPEGLALGYVMDMEDHRGLLEGFRPDGVTAWDGVKTKGDSMCKFRMFIPELVTGDDPIRYRTEP